MQSPLNTDRGKLRMEKLKQLELEQLQWEQEALVMPEYLNRALTLSFESVKTEFSDLDGLSWSRYRVEEPTPKLTCAEVGAPDTVAAHPPRHPPAQETIRASHLHPSQGPANQFSHNASHAHPPQNLTLACHLPTLHSHQ